VDGVVRKGLSIIIELEEQLWKTTRFEHALSPTTRVGI